MPSGEHDDPSIALREVIAPIVLAGGLALAEVDVSWAGARRVLRVFVEQVDDEAPPPTLDEVAVVARSISEFFDQQDPFPDVAYVLEVSTPGVDRPLTTAAHYRRNLRRRLVLTLTQDRTVTGRLLELIGPAQAPTHLRLLADGVKRGTTKELTLEWAELLRGQVEVEFRVKDGAPGSELDLDEADLD